MPLYAMPPIGTFIGINDRQRDRWAQNVEGGHTNIQTVKQIKKNRLIGDDLKILTLG